MPRAIKKRPGDNFGKRNVLASRNNEIFSKEELK